MSSHVALIVSLDSGISPDSIPDAIIQRSRSINVDMKRDCSIIRVIDMSFIILDLMNLFRSE